MHTVSQDLGWQDADAQALCPTATSAIVDAAPAKAAKKAAVPEKKGAPSVASTAAAVGEETVIGLDVPCHVAAISSHHSAMQQLSGSLTAAVTAFKDEVYAWQMSEQADQARWSGYIAKLKELV